MKKWFFFCSINLICLFSCSRETLTPSDHEARSSSKVTPSRPFQYDYQSNVAGSLHELSNGLIVEKYDSIYVLGGDMLFYEEDLWRVEQFFTEKNTARAGVSPDATEYWPGRRIPYEYASGFTAPYQYYAEQAMADISSMCGVIFTPAQAGDAHRIVFTPSNSNNSHVGMASQRTQPINLVLPNTLSSSFTSTITHELLHALGFYHEQSRPDRDHSIVVNYANIRPGKRHNFDKYSAALCVGPFDFNSIMLYPSIITDTRFVYDTNIPVMTTVDGFIFGRGAYLSYYDIAGLKSIYGPPYHKIHTERETVQDYFDHALDVYEEHAVTTIVFYADEACTIPAQTSFPRVIRLQVTQQYANINHQVETNSWYESITIPAGTSFFLVDDRYNCWIEEWGSPANVDFRDYSIVNHH